MSLLITGGTGFVGRQLIHSMGHRLIEPKPSILAVSRNPERSTRMLGDLVDQVLQWDPISQPLQLPAGSEVGQVVNLMGESIAEGRWTAAKKKRIRDSRVLGTRRLVDGLLATGKAPEVFVSASAIGVYGDPGETEVDEGYRLNDDFAASVCRDWEAEAERLTDHGTRVVCLRIGIVLGGDGGAIDRMLPIFRWGLGGKLGSGRQWMSWIHVDDLVSMIHWSLACQDVCGAVNATAPNPVRNVTFTRQLAAAVNRPAVLPVPKFALRAVFGEFANSLFFSQRIIPKKATELGFQFEYPELKTALAAIV